MTRVSIVVPALDEERHIAQCLAALAAMTVPPACAAEVIVVDNGSSDRTVDIARQCGVRVLIRPGVRIAALRNAGAAEAGGEILAFVDADCIPATSWLAAALACLERTRSPLVGNFYTNPADAGWIAATAERITLRKRADAAYVPGGNLVVTRRCFEAVGGFDERLETNEDVDFCARVRKSGAGLVCDPAIVSTHLGVPRSVGQFFRREMWFGRTAFALFWRDLTRVTNLRLVLFSLYFALLIVCALAAGVAVLVTGSLAALAIPAVGLVLIVAWLCYRIGTPRRHWLDEVAYTLLYGLARGAALVQAAVASVGALRRRANPPLEARR